MLQFAGAKKSIQRQMISDTRKLAEKYLLNAHFADAIGCYSELVNMLSAFKSKMPCELGNAYQRFATANLLRANQLMKTDPAKAELYRAQGVLQIQQAILSYPSNATKELAACKAKLLDLTGCRAQVTLEEEDVDVEALSFEEVIQKQPEVLYWKKMLLDRYRAEQHTAGNALSVETPRHKVTNKY